MDVRIEQLRINCQSINQSIDRSINRSIDRSIDQSINRSVGRSVDRSINQSIKSINGLLNNVIPYNDNSVQTIQQELPWEMEN